MKAYKILNTAFIAVLTAALTLDMVKKTKDSHKLISDMQRVMQINFAKYGVHILETNKHLFGAMKHIESLQEDGDLAIFELIEVEVEIVKEERKPNMSNFLEFLLEMEKAINARKQAKKKQDVAENSAQAKTNT